MKWNDFKYKHNLHHIGTQVLHVRIKDKSDMEWEGDCEFVSEWQEVWIRNPWCLNDNTDYGGEPKYLQVIPYADIVDIEGGEPRPK